MYPRAKQFPQSISLTRNVTPRNDWCPPIKVGKALSKPSVLQAVIDEIVTEILFWQCAFSKPWNKCLGSRSQTSAIREQRPGLHMCARENKTTGARNGYRYCTLETLEGETSLEYNNTGRYKDNIMQVPLEVLRGRWLHKDNNVRRKKECSR